MILEIILVLLVLLLVTSCYIIWNLTMKLETLEDWIVNFMDAAEKIQFDLKQIDYKGSFEADDETGVIFNQIKEIVNQLNKFKREGYWILEDELEITNDHPILIDGEWILAEEYAGKKEYIDEATEVVYVETENELLTVKDWTVGGKY